jgi:hypothetical protein
MKNKTVVNLFALFLAFTGPVVLSACVANNGGGSESAQTAIAQLSTPTAFSLSGSGTSQVGTSNFIFATSGGTIDTSGNTVTALISDPYTPLSLNSTAVYSIQMSTGTCSSLGNLVTSVVGTSSNVLTTQLSATGCSDQSTIDVLLNTTQIYDNSGLSGTDVVTLAAVVDLAPKVSPLGIATGNVASNGTGATYSTLGDFSIASDNSIVVTFSKSLVSGTLNATLSGCSAILGTPSLVTGLNNETVAWPLSGFSGFSTGNTCVLNVSGIIDAAGNPEDPNDPNINMTLTFQ